MQKTGLKGAFHLKPFSLAIPDEELKLKAVTCRPTVKLPGFDSAYTGYFEREDCGALKKNIVLHFTAGHLTGDIRTLSLPRKKDDGVTYKTRFRLSVPFVIARDGTIYNLFSSKYWSGHIGTTSLGNSRTYDKKSIGIELSNAGPLRLVGEDLFYKDNKQFYCKLSDEAYYTKTEEPFREQQYFATFTDAQYNSLIILLRYLTTSYTIPRKFLDRDKRYIASKENSDFNGIVSHINFRSKDKWDLGPAFDWDKVIQGVQADTYTDTTTTETELESTKGMRGLVPVPVFDNETDLENEVFGSPKSRSFIQHNVGEEDDLGVDLGYEGVEMVGF